MSELQVYPDVESPWFVDSMPNPPSNPLSLERVQNAVSRATAGYTWSGK